MEHTVNWRLLRHCASETDIERAVVASQTLDRRHIVAAVLQLRLTTPWMKLAGRAVANRQSTKAHFKSAHALFRR